MVIIMETFDSTKISLFEILKDVHSGKIQLPDFQRGWIWDDDRIKGILASVAKSFPIGAIMLLETGNENVRFKTKPDIPDEELPAVSCKRKDMLNLSLEDYKKYRDPIQNACLFKKSIPIQKIVNRHKK